MPASPEKRVLLLVGEVLDLLDVNEFCHGLLVALREAVPSDWSALNEVPADLPTSISLAEPPVPEHLHMAFAQLATSNPIAAHFLATRDGRATRISDLITRRQLHHLPLYREVYAQLGIEYQIAFTLPSSAGRILGVVLSRTRRDFTARERDLLNLARPYLIQTYRNALQASSAPKIGEEIPTDVLLALGLTHRQAEVMRLIATGHTAPQAAATLEIAPRTAQKHVELAYRTLGVGDRSEASRVVWAAVRNRG